MVTSGNSWRSRLNTSPIDRYVRALTASPSRPRSSLVCRRQVHELELPDLDLVAGGQDRFLDPLPIDICPVERADISNGIACTVVHELGVTPGHGDVVQEDVALG